MILIKNLVMRVNKLVEAMHQLLTVKHTTNDFLLNFYTNLTLYSAWCPLKL